VRWWIGLLAAAAITFALYSAGVGYPVLYVARRIVFHLIGGH
jgi:hypothetical protein